MISALAILSHFPSINLPPQLPIPFRFPAKQPGWIRISKHSKFKLTLSIVSSLTPRRFNRIFSRKCYRRRLQKHAQSATTGSHHDKGLNVKFTGKLELGQDLINRSSVSGVFQIMAVIIVNRSWLRHSRSIRENKFPLKFTTL